MSLVIKDTKELINPEKLRLNILLYALPGVGKTSWAATAPTPGFAACETGQGKGLLSIAEKGLPYCEPSNISEFEAVCGGQVFKSEQTIVIDSLSEMVKTFIKDYALSIPRARGESEKRRKGVPELDDYGVMGELTRRLLRKLLDANPDKHVVVTATERYDKPDPENGQAEILIGPDLPGQMFLGSTAMFDLVLRMRTRPALRDVKDPKSKYTQRYFLTQPDGAGSVVKCRLNSHNKPVLDREEIFDPQTGQGTFSQLLEKIARAYAGE